MKYADINKRFSEIVADYLSKGYTINTNTMGGTQGRCRVDFTDGKEVIRVTLDSFKERGTKENDYTCFDGVEIIVGKCCDDVNPNSCDSWDIIWNSNLEVIQQERFYWIGNDFYGTKEEVLHAERTRLQRIEGAASGSVIHFADDKAMKIAKRYISKKTGVKRISSAAITVRKICGESDNTYMIEYRGKNYSLH